MNLVFLQNCSYKNKKCTQKPNSSYKTKVRNQLAANLCDLPRQQVLV